MGRLIFSSKDKRTVFWKRLEQAQAAVERARSPRDVLSVRDELLSEKVGQGNTIPSLVARELWETWADAERKL